MEAGSGCGHGPWLVGIDGLVAIAVFVGTAVGSCDLRGERNLTVIFEDFGQFRLPVIMERDSDPAFAQLFENSTGKVVLNGDD